MYEAPWLAGAKGVAFTSVPPSVLTAQLYQQSVSLISLHVTNHIHSIIISP